MTQHKNGLNILNSYKLLFGGLGNLKQKSGSDKVWVYSLKGTKYLKEYVIPFYQNYLVPYSSKHKADMFEKFVLIIKVLYKHLGQGLEKEQLIELIHLIYSMNPDSKGKPRKRDIQDVINIINNWPT